MPWMHTHGIGVAQKISRVYITSETIFLLYLLLVFSKVLLAQNRFSSLFSFSLRHRIVLTTVSAMKTCESIRFVQFAKHRSTILSLQISEKCIFHTCTHYTAFARTPLKYGELAKRRIIISRQKACFWPADDANDAADDEEKKKEKKKNEEDPQTSRMRSCNERGLIKEKGKDWRMKIIDRQSEAIEKKIMVDSKHREDCVIGRGIWARGKGRIWRVVRVFWYGGSNQCLSYSHSSSFVHGNSVDVVILQPNELRVSKGTHASFIVSWVNWWHNSITSEHELTSSGGSHTLNGWITPHFLSTGSSLHSHCSHFVFSARSKILHSDCKESLYYLYKTDLYSKRSHQVSVDLTILWNVKAPIIPNPYQSMFHPFQVLLSILPLPLPCTALRDSFRQDDEPVQIHTWTSKITILTKW